MIALVTGSSSGIGKECCLSLAKIGYDLILVARRFDRLQELKLEIEQLGRQAVVKQLDIRDRKSVFEMAGSIEKVDVLINNAGLALGVDHLLDTPAEAVETMIETNLKGYIHMTQAIYPKLSPNAIIVNMSSIAGLEAYPGGSIYCATKFAVDAMTKALRLELMDTPIRVTSIEPGIVHTEASLVRYGGDKEQADAVYKGLEPLLAIDVAETVAFVVTRPKHVQISSMVVFATSQAGAKLIHRT
ncbi:hypothetical protein EDD86DRAFT_260377 [Gorgonomyces haynaldii]|nr:hypothetical protein EDD86DRAFT_260377 [Gorgonomyces haynaldii]